MDGSIWGAVALVALLLGGAIGWLLGTRGQAGGAATAASLRMQLDGVARERDDARGEVAAIRSQLDSARTSHGNVQSELAALKAGQAERDRAFEERIAEVHAAKESLSAQFSEIGGKILGEAQKAFLERADQRFGQAGEKTEERIKLMLAPVGERLKAYEDQVGRIEKERTEAYGDIKATIEQVRVGAERVQTEAARLVSSLRNAPKARGRWGEQQLKNLLERCGLSEHVDFVTERSVDTEEGRLRPDAIVHIPGNQILVIDAKVSLNAYQDAFDAVDEDSRRIAMGNHCASMRAHIDGLSRKAYWNQFEEAPDFVIMFVPGEHFVSAALEHDHEIWEYAFEKRVLLSTPTNLVAIAKTIAGVWRQEKMAAEARTIGQLGKELYARLETASSHLRTMGSGLNTAVSNYNKFVGSFERNVLSTGRKFATLNIDTGSKELGEVAELEALPRYSGGEEGAIAAE